MATHTYCYAYTNIHHITLHYIAFSTMIDTLKQVIAFKLCFTGKTSEKTRRSVCLTPIIKWVASWKCVTHKLGGSKHTQVCLPAYTAPINPNIKALHHRVASIGLAPCEGGIYHMASCSIVTWYWHGNIFVNRFVFSCIHDWHNLLSFIIYSFIATPFPCCITYRMQRCSRMPRRSS